MKIFNLLLLASTALAQSASPQPEVNASTVVFVCEHGAAKSVIAAAHFNRLASELKLPYRAVARGTNPDDAVSPTVRSGLAMEGLDVTTWKPKAVSEEDITRAGRVVSLATDLPAKKPSVKPKLLEWNDIPPVSQDYTAARAAIVREVEMLVKKLADEKPTAEVKK
jgi:arsenate reductase (thioredoxin)